MPSAGDKRSPHSLTHSGWWENNNNTQNVIQTHINHVLSGSHFYGRVDQSPYDGIAAPGDANPRPLGYKLLFALTITALSRLYFTLLLVGFVVRGESPGCRLISTDSMLEWLRALYTCNCVLGYGNCVSCYCNCVFCYCVLRYCNCVPYIHISVY